MTNEFDQAAIESYRAEINNCTRLTNRMNDNNPRSAAKILAKRKGNYSGHIKLARISVNSILESKGLPAITEDWEGVVKAPTWYKGNIETVIHNDNYIGGGVNF